jgi:hypothetical protein
MRSSTVSLLLLAALAVSFNGGRPAARVACGIALRHGRAPPPARLLYFAS